MEVLPQDLMARVFNCLDTTERARVSLVCKTWKQVSEENLSRVKLSFSSLDQLEAHREWLDKVAVRGASTVRFFELQWRGGKLLHPAAGSLHIEHFVNLEVLHLKPPTSAYWAMNPKAVQCLAPLGRLKELVLAFSPASMTRMEPVTLEQFAAFPRLQLLSIMLTPLRGWERGWHVELGPEIGGLQQLRSFTLAGVTRLVITPALEQIVGRLQHFDLGVKEELLQVLQAPKLAYLRYHCPSAQRLPFRGCNHLAELAFNGPKLQANELAELIWLERLTLGYLLQTVSALYVSKLAGLRCLREIKLLHYKNRAGVDPLGPFAAFDRLEMLQLSVNTPVPVEYSPAALSSLKCLKEVKLYSLVGPSVYLGPGVESLPALESLHADISHSEWPLSSPTLQSLSLEGSGSYIMGNFPTLQSFPQLRSLQLQLLPNMRDCTMLAAQLAQLPNLQELFLVKGYSAAPMFLNPPETPPEPAGTLERMLHSLRQLPGLRVLQVAAVNDCVSLSRTILPGVAHFGLACKGLAVCPSCLPWSCASLDLIFHRSNEHTRDLLEHSARLTAFNTDGIPSRPMWKAILHSQGQPPCQFGEEIFDDFIDERQSAARL